MFRISLPSNASSEYFPKNTPSNYRVKLPHIFDSTKKYECALSEIIFPNKFKNIRKGLNNIEVKLESGKVKPFPITPGYYSTIAALISKIKRTIKWIDIIYNKAKKITIVKSAYQIKFGDDIARLLGFSGKTWIEGGRKLIKSPYHATVHGGLTTLYVYTDIIQEQFVGEKAVPILRIVNWDHKIEKDNMSVSFDRLYYSPLKNTSFDTINIFIMDDTGTAVEFEYGKVVVVLEFKEML